MAQPVAIRATRTADTHTITRRLTVEAATQRGETAERFAPQAGLALHLDTYRRPDGVSLLEAILRQH